MKKRGAKQQAGYKVLILGNKCYRCGHEWRPLNVEEQPAVCPKCKNPYWSKPRRKSSEKNDKNNNKK